MTIRWEDTAILFYTLLPFGIIAFAHIVHLLVKYFCRRAGEGVVKDDEDLRPSMNEGRRDIRGRVQSQGL
jgi:hypothetical protein